MYKGILCRDLIEASKPRCLDNFLIISDGGSQEIEMSYLVWDSSNSV